MHSGPSTRLVERDPPAAAYVGVPSPTELNRPSSAPRIDGSSSTTWTTGQSLVWDGIAYDGIEGYLPPTLLFQVMNWYDDQASRMNRFMLELLIHSERRNTEYSVTPPTEK